MICEICLTHFPDGYVNKLVVSAPDGWRHPYACGVCALELMRAAHGDPTLEFHGPQARALYEKAKAYKEKLAKEAKTL